MSLSPSLVFDFPNVLVREPSARLAWTCSLKNGRLEESLEDVMMAPEAIIYQIYHLYF